jgi:post-segregation antitoxin (ccd killing protein)
MATRSDIPIDQAIAAVGGVARLGDILGVAHTSVVRWRQSGHVPAERVLALEAATGVPRHRLRPDLYPARSEPPAPGLAEVQIPFEAEARALGIDVGKVAAEALRAAISAEKARRWAEENRAAIEAWSRFFEQNDTPLAEYRMF